ncbi:MAG: hypothetical protein FJX46_00235 [Alphaproteobacteria bacterium]|nr:hypothetical protein [Alphaproteobacteria bacterium]
MPELIVNDVAPRVQYTANGAQTVFTFPFPVLEAGDLKVWFNDGTNSSSFAIAGLGDSNGGSITFTTPPTNGTRVTILRDMPVRRLADFQEAGEFRASAINAELDRLTLMIQQVEERSARASTLPATAITAATELPPPVADAYLRWNSGATALASDLTVPTGVTNAAASAAAAATSATAAASSASAAATSATSAASSATAAASSASAIQGFRDIAVSGQSTVVADAVADTLTLAAGSNVTLTTDAGTDTITIAAANQAPTAGTGIAVSGQQVSFSPSGLTTVTVDAANDYVVITDASDSNNPKKVTASSLGGAPTAGTGIGVSGQQVSFVPSGLSTVSLDSNNDKFVIADNSASNAPKLAALVEYGTWTPVWQFGGSSSGITYDGQVGRYWTFGNIVYCAYSIDLSNKGSASGGVTISGLPFSPDANNIACSIVAHHVELTNVQSLPFFLWLTTGTSMYLYQSAVGADAVTAVTNTQCTNNSRMHGSFTYVRA